MPDDPAQTKNRIIIPPAERPGIGVAVLIWKGKKLLLGKRISGGEDDSWQFPGGHLEAGESVLSCARREVLEETGLLVDEMRHLCFTDTPFYLAGKPYITLFVSCEYAAGEAEVREPEKCACWQWYDYTGLPQPLFEPINTLLKQLPTAWPPADEQASDGNDLYALHAASAASSESP